MLELSNNIWPVSLERCAGVQAALVMIFTLCFDARLEKDNPIGVKDTKQVHIPGNFPLDTVESLA